MFLGLHWGVWVFIGILVVFGYFIIASGKQGEENIQKAWWDSLDDKIKKNEERE